MNDEEEIVQKLLKKNYHENLLFEPDGNIPPDFKVGDHTAVEVRRLNQNCFKVEPVEGLENLEIPLFDAFRDVLNSFGKQKSETSYFIGFDFNRPVNIHELKRQLQKKLQAFLQNPIQTFPYKVLILKEFEITILKTISTDKNLFRYMGSMDKDEGGSVISTYVENIRYCIYEKSEKINRYLQRYKEWWLFLVDKILWDFYEFEVNKIIKNIQYLGNFDRVSIIRNSEEFIIIEKS